MIEFLFYICKNVSSEGVGGVGGVRGAESTGGTVVSAGGAGDTAGGNLG
ncbi:hypothetical protein H477_6009 [[Clostridium] sordellii ATCC 9714]|nr:hypothetical protein H477_6009 [[Clostridium] sordellii ATCC 9714] [Paeniclostridium sordellii ATCC 9714]